MYDLYLLVLFYYYFLYLDDSLHGTELLQKPQESRAPGNALILDEKCEKRGK